MSRRRGIDRVAGLLEFAMSEPGIICELIAEYLRAEGHSPVMATNGREGLESFQRERQSTELVFTIRVSACDVADQLGFELAEAGTDGVVEPGVGRVEHGTCLRNAMRVACVLGPHRVDDEDEKARADAELDAPPGQLVEHGESLLFCRDRDPEREAWDGPRAGQEGGPVVGVRDHE